MDATGTDTDPPLRVLTASNPSGVAVHVAGELDMATAPLLKDSIEAVLDSGAATIEIDCAELSFVDSSGVSLLLQAWNESRDRITAPIRVVNVPPQIQRVLEVCGVADILLG